MSREDKYTDIITARIEYLEKRITEDDSNKAWNREKSEVSALRWALEYTRDEEQNVKENRAYNNGQKTILRYYKKSLKKAVKANNLSALQFLLDRTTEWLDEKENDETKV